MELDGQRFKRIGAAFGRPWPNEDTDEGDVLMGVVTSQRSIPNKFKRGTTQALCEITDSDGATWTLYESAQTKEFLEAIAIGSEVRVVYEGTVPIKGRKEPMKAFSCFIADAGVE